MPNRWPWLQRLRARLALPALPTDAAAPPDPFYAWHSAGAELDKRWPDLHQEFTDAREAWRRNPLARRLVGLVTSYVVGDGLSLASDDPDLAAFVAAFWNDEQNALSLRQHTWCDELTRSGELFITLHLNPVSGMSYVRALPATSIDRVEFAPGDYEHELAYHEVAPFGDPDYPTGRTWLAPDHPTADEPLSEEQGLPAAAPHYAPVCLHFAVNRPAGCVRGESDLAPVLPWLKRYDGWLVDRTRLNAAIRAFLWIVKVPGRKLEGRRAELARPPEPGSVLVIDRENEEWEAVAPSLNAHDAAADGRAIRWMIASGGPGIGLVDLGEAEEANLATARAMAEQRSRFMRARQAYFAYVLTRVALTAYNRAVRLGLWHGAASAGGAGPAAVQSGAAIRVTAPDISPSDNRELGAGASEMAAALGTLTGLGLTGDRWRRLALRLILKFAGESIDDTDLTAILADSQAVG